MTLLECTPNTACKVRKLTNGSWAQQDCTPWLRRYSTFEDTGNDLCIGESFSACGDTWTVVSLSHRGSANCQRSVIKAVAWQMMKPLCTFALVDIKNNLKASNSLQPKKITDVTGSALFVGGDTRRADNIIWPEDSYLIAIDHPVCDIRVRRHAISDGTYWYVIQEIVDSGCIDDRPYLHTVRSVCPRFDQ